MLEIWYRFLALFKDDMVALVPNSSVPLSKETFMRIAVYGAFLIFILRMFLSISVPSKRLLNPFRNEYEGKPYLENSRDKTRRRNPKQSPLEEEAHRKNQII